MTSQKILASLAGAMLLASPVVASAATPAKPAAATKDACKNLKGSALKNCLAKEKKAAKKAK